MTASNFGFFAGSSDCPWEVFGVLPSETGTHFLKRAPEMFIKIISRKRKENTVAIPITVIFNPSIMNANLIKGNVGDNTD